MRFYKYIFLAVVIIVLQSQFNFGQEFRIKKTNNTRALIDSLQLFINPNSTIDPKLDIAVRFKLNQDMTYDKANSTIEIYNTPNYTTLDNLYLKKPALYYDIMNLAPSEKEDLRPIKWHHIFTAVTEKMELDSNLIVLKKPELQYIPMDAFINEYFTLFGGERLGLPINADLGIGLSFGFGTPYGGPLESNFYEANFHILGASVGAFNSFGDITEFYPRNNHNNVYAALGFQVSYCLPISNFIEVQYQGVIDEINDAKKEEILKKVQVVNNDGTVFNPKFLSGNYFNYELRYPVTVLNCSRGKIYFASYQKEYHLGARFYEISLGRRIDSKFDLRLDWMFDDTEGIRRPQLNCDLLVTNLFDQFAKDSFGFGPALSFSKDENGKFNLLKAFVNIRIKLNEKPVQQ